MYDLVLEDWYGTTSNIGSKDDNGCGSAAMPIPAATSYDGRTTGCASSSSWWQAENWATGNWGFTTGRFPYPKPLSVLNKNIVSDWTCSQHIFFVKRPRIWYWEELDPRPFVFLSWVQLRSFLGASLGLFRGVRWAAPVWYTWKNQWIYQHGTEMDFPLPTYLWMIH